MDVSFNLTTARQLTQSLPSSIKTLKLRADGPLETSNDSSVTQALGQSIQSMQDIESIDLHNTGLGLADDGQGVRAIGDGLVGKTALQTLDTTGNTFSSNPSANAGMLELLNGAVDSSHPCIQFDSSPIPNTAWSATDGSNSAVDAAWAKARDTLIKQCQSQLCFGDTISGPPLCGEGSLSSSDQVQTSGASSSGGMIIDTVKWVRSLMPSSQRSPNIVSLSSGRLQQTESSEDFLSRIQLTEEDIGGWENSDQEESPDWLLPLQPESEPTTWFGKAFNNVTGFISKLGDSFADTVGGWIDSLVDGSKTLTYPSIGKFGPLYQPQNLYGQIYAGNSTLALSFAPTALALQ